MGRTYYNRKECVENGLTEPAREEPKSQTYEQSVVTTQCPDLAALARLHNLANLFTVTYKSYPTKKRN